VADVILRLDYKLLKSSHEILDCLLSLPKGEEAFLCVSSDVWGLKRLFELIRKLVEGAHGIEPLGDVKVRPSSCSVLSFHIGQDDQYLLTIRRLLFEAGEVQLDRAPPLDILGPFTIIWLGLGGNRFANTDVRPYERIGGEEPWGLGSRRKVDYVWVMQGLRVPGMVGLSEVFDSSRDRSHIEIDGTRR